MLTLKLKSRAFWICEGEANTKYFNSFSSAKRNSKIIWDLNDNEGKLITTDATLKQLGEQHFADLSVLINLGLLGCLRPLLRMKR